MSRTLIFKYPDNEPHFYGWAAALKYKDRRQLPGSISFPAIPSELPEKAVALHCSELPVSDAPWIDDCGDLPLLIVLDKDDRMIGAIVISMEPVAVALFAAPVVLGEQRAFDLLDGHPSFDESSVLCLGAIEVLFEEWPSLPDNRLFLFLFFVLASTPATPARGTAGRGRYNSRRLWLGFVFLDERSYAVGTNGRKREQHNRRNANESVLLRRLQWHGFGSLSRNRRWLVHLRSLAIASAAAPDVACFALRDAGVATSLARGANLAARVAGCTSVFQFSALELPKSTPWLDSFGDAIVSESALRYAASFLGITGTVTPLLGSTCHRGHLPAGVTLVVVLVAVAMAKRVVRLDVRARVVCVPASIGRRVVVIPDLSIGRLGTRQQRVSRQQRHDRAPFFPRRQSTLRVQGRRFCSYVSLPAGIRKGQVASIGRTGL